MSEDLSRILIGVAEDLERDGYAIETVAGAMAMIGIQIMYGPEQAGAARALERLRNFVLEYGEWPQ